MKNIIYGIGGYDLEKPNNNIIKIIELSIQQTPVEENHVTEDADKTALNALRLSAETKLKALGLTVEEIAVLMK